VEIDSSARWRLGSGFGGGDKRISEGFEEDEQEFWTSLSFFFFGLMFVKEPVSCFKINTFSLKKLPHNPVGQN
jgi:hypothetical protein